jgi:hypothetical protein
MPQDSTRPEAPQAGTHTQEAAGADPSEAARRRLVRQVLESRTFAKSARLSQFFEFICARTLEGRAESINEQQIGIHVFGRSSSYSAADDSIVRSQARLLRQRLEEYFEHECTACATVIRIPKGGYVPVFERRGSPSASAPAPAAQTPQARATRHAGVAGSGRSAARWIAACAAAALLAFGALALWLHPFAPARPAASSLLWSAIFDAGRPVVIVPSDDGLVLTEETRRGPVTLDEYLSGDYLRNPSASALPAGSDPAGRPGAGLVAPMPGAMTSDWLSSHQYTSTADLDLALRLSRLPQADRTDLQPRYARSVRLDDLKTSNVVLIGGIGANPWVGLYAAQLNFDVNYDFKTREGYVINRHPRPGEQAKYLESHTDGSVSNYGVLAYLPGVSGVGSALLFEGSGMAGTEAAADFPFNTAAFAGFIDRLGRGPGGTLPYFELLLETRSLNGNAPAARILAWRRIPS